MFYFVLGFVSKSKYQLSQEEAPSKPAACGKKFPFTKPVFCSVPWLIARYELGEKLHRNKESDRNLRDVKNTKWLNSLLDIPKKFVSLSDLLYVYVCKVLMIQGTRL